MGTANRSKALPIAPGRHDGSGHGRFARLGDRPKRDGTEEEVRPVQGVGFAEECSPTPSTSSMRCLSCRGSDIGRREEAGFGIELEGRHADALDVAHLLGLELDEGAQPVRPFLRVNGGRTADIAAVSTDALEPR